MRTKRDPSLVGERQRCVALAEAAGIPVPPCPTPQMLFEIEQEALAQMGLRCAPADARDSVERHAVAA